MNTFEPCGIELTNKKKKTVAFGAVFSIVGVIAALTCIMVYFLLRP